MQSIRAAKPLSTSSRAVLTGLGGTGLLVISFEIASISITPFFPGWDLLKPEALGAMAVIMAIITGLGARGLFILSKSHPRAFKFLSLGLFVGVILAVGLW